MHPNQWAEAPKVNEVRKPINVGYSVWTEPGKYEGMFGISERQEAKAFAKRLSNRNHDKYFFVCYIQSTHLKGNQSGDSISLYLNGNNLWRTQEHKNGRP